MVNYNPGDKIKVELSDRSYNGMVIPSVDKGLLVLKLKSGYNIGISIKKIKKVTIISRKESKKVVKKEIKQKKGLPTISILHTGGTIASKVDYETGGVVSGFDATDLIAMFPSIMEIANFNSRNVLNLMSEDIMFSDYSKLVKAIVEEVKKGSKGIIIGHGTDTLAITSAALSFVFENLPIPVLLVGSQRSSDRGSTDAKLNLLNAAYFITKTDFVGVGICMHRTSNDEDCVILPGTKTKKLHTSRRDAFQAVNSSPIAVVNYSKDKISYFSDYPKKEGKLVVRDKFENKVAILKVYPNMNHDFIDVMIGKKYKGFILEGSGLGHAPANSEENLKNYKALDLYIKGGGMVVITSNCIFGEVHEDVYKNLRRLKEIGCIFGEDMLTETAYIKLAWLLGNYSSKEARSLITKNLRGEISLRRNYNKNFI